MSVNKVIFLGDSHVRGDGVEWPQFHKLVEDDRDNPLTAKKWTLFLKENRGNFSTIRKEFINQINESKIDFNSISILDQLRKENCWAKLFVENFKNFDLEYFNFASNVESNFNIASNLAYGLFHEGAPIQDFKDTLVIAGLTYAQKDLTYYQPAGGDSSKLKNVTIPRLGQTIMFMKEYVENRGGHFAYMHIDDFPEELYDPKFNPFAMNIMPHTIFENSFYSNLTPDRYWRRYDGLHYGADTQKFLAEILYDKIHEVGIREIFGDDNNMLP